MGHYPNRLSKHKVTQQAIHLQNQLIGTLHLPKSHIKSNTKPTK